MLLLSRSEVTCDHGTAVYLNVRCLKSRVRVRRATIREKQHLQALAMRMKYERPVMTTIIIIIRVTISITVTTIIIMGTT